MSVIYPPTTKISKTSRNRKLTIEIWFPTWKNIYWSIIYKSRKVRYISETKYQKQNIRNKTNLLGHVHFWFFTRLILISLEGLEVFLVGNFWTPIVLRMTTFGKRNWSSSFVPTSKSCENKLHHYLQQR